jgi:EmrB/QacA subfamily drug resistance transporter
MLPCTERECIVPPCGYSEDISFRSANGSSLTEVDILAWNALRTVSFDFLRVLFVSLVIPEQAESATSAILSAGWKIKRKILGGSILSTPESVRRFGASIARLKQPCDEAVIRAEIRGYPCLEKARPWVLAATILGSSMAFIDSTVVNVALPALQSNLHATVVDVQWVVESYGLFLSALILVGGALGDSVGRRATFMFGVGAFAAASAGCGFSSSIRSLVIWRCLQGIGAAFLVPGSLAIIGASFDERSRGQAIGTWSGFTAITSALGPVLGGWLIEHASWHWVFLINLPIAALVIAISAWHVPPSRSSQARNADWLGATTATLALLGLVYGFLESATLGWRDPRVLATLFAGITCLAIFLFIEKHVAAPMVPLELFRSATFSGANLLTLFLYAALGIFFFLFPLNLIQVHRYSATATGAAALPMILLMFFLSRWSGGLVGHYGPRTPLIIGPLIAAAGFLLFAIASMNARYWTALFGAFVVLGLGMAVSVAPLTTVVMSSVEQDRAGTASGINNALARVAGVLAVAILGVVMVAAFAHSLRESLVSQRLDPGIVNQLEANATRLGGLDPPPNQDPQTAATIRTAVAQSFVFGFRIIMLICAALASASAVVAARMIPTRGAERLLDFGKLQPE